jgi:hypothetical protein
MERVCITDGMQVIFPPNMTSVNNGGCMGKSVKENLFLALMTLT